MPVKSWNLRYEMLCGRHFSFAVARLAHLTPIPRGDSVEPISRQLRDELDAAFAARPHAGGSARLSTLRLLW